MVVVAPSEIQRVGYIIIQPWVPSESYRRDYANTSGRAVDANVVITLDTNIANQIPRSPERYDIGKECEEKLLLYGGTISLFKCFKNARSLLARRIRSGDCKGYHLYAVSLALSSSNLKEFLEQLRNVYGEEFSNALMLELPSTPAGQVLGWDVADIQGISLVSDTAYDEQPAFPRNDTGLIESFRDAESLSQFGNLRENKKQRNHHGPFIEWMLELIVNGEELS